MFQYYIQYQNMHIYTILCFWYATVQLIMIYFLLNVQALGCMSILLRAQPASLWTQDNTLNTWLKNILVFTRDVKKKVVFHTGLLYHFTLYKFYFNSYSSN